MGSSLIKMKSKTIRDPIHGDIKLEGLFLELIETPEIQRLYNIKQLGFAHLVFPGAHHTRLEHSLGSYHMAYKAAESLNLSEEEKNLIACAAILHDIGHGPFSHTLESILRNTFNVDHVDLTEKLILGKYEIYDSKEKKIMKASNVSDILDKHDIDKKEIVNIIRGKTYKKSYFSQLLNSTIDVDQLDYLVRYSYYTCVAYGMIDVERFLQTLTVKEDNLAVKRKGVSVVENILMARALMYSSVYFHKTVRIAELMLSKTIELIENIEPFEYFKMTDAELINDLRMMDSFQYEIATRLKYRNLFKQAYTLSESDLDERQNEAIAKLDDFKSRREKEIEFEELLGIPRGHIIIDIPENELHQAEPRIDKTDIKILDGNEIKPFDSYTPIGGALKSRVIPDWVVMIVTDEKYRNMVSKKADEILFN